jgi:hypothetical protein
MGVNRGTMGIRMCLRVCASVSLQQCLRILSLRVSVHQNESIPVSDSVCTAVSIGMSVLRVTVPVLGTDHYRRRGANVPSL